MILHELHLDARTPVSGPEGIAKRVGLANNPCRKRIQRLESEGYIAGYTIKIDPSKTRFKGGFAYVSIGLAKGNKESALEMCEFLNKTNCVIMCDLVSGRHDILVKIGYKNTRELQKIHESIMSHPLCEDIETQTTMQIVREYHIEVDQVE